MKVAQGNSLGTNYAFNNTFILPQLGTGRPGNFLTQSIYGASKFYDSSTPFVDTSKPTSELYMNQPLEIRDGVPWGDYHSIDNALEPFTIRDEISFTSIEKPIYRGIKARLTNVNKDIFGNNNLIVIKYNYKSVGNNVAYFIDSAKEEFIINDQEMRNHFFEDDTINTRYLSAATAVGLIPDISFTETVINATILAGGVSGSYKWDNYLGRDEKTGICGFIYNNNVWGTDSIAFGGLER